MVIGKLQNLVISWGVIILITVVSFNGYSQTKIKGIFLVEYKLNDFGRSFSFDKNGVFKTESSGHLGVESYGKGHYLIRNDSLFLNYDLTELKEDSYHKYKLYRNLQDSILVKVSVSSFKKKPLSGILVANVKDRSGAKTDENGIVFLKFKKQKGQKKIAISALCCGNYSLFINSAFNYEIDVFLKQNKNGTAIKNQIVKYKILKHSKEEIRLQTGKQLLVLRRKE
jgi:hypothetical protein